MKSSTIYVRLSFFILAIAFAYPAAAQMTSTFMSGAMYGHYYHYVDPVWLYEKRRDEGRDVSSFQREKDGVGLPFAQFEITRRLVRMNSTDETIAADSSSTINTKTTFKFSFNGSSSWEVGKMGSKASLMLTTGIASNFWKFQEKNVDLTSEFGPKEFSLWQLCIPVTFDYKFGAEAKMSKSMKTGYTVGFGPCLVMSSATCTDGASATYFKAAPYLKMSYGFFWHTFLSVEATALTGSFSFMDNNPSADFSRDNGFENNTFYTLKSGSVFTFGITWMPFSFDWEE
ncbi:MAG: hypothetical protein ABI378_14280 [Chitinophagaceae bacterium]